MNVEMFQQTSGVQQHANSKCQWKCVLKNSVLENKCFEEHKWEFDTLYLIMSVSCTVCYIYYALIVVECRDVM